MKKVWAVYFSGTGTTKKTVNFIADKLAEKFKTKKEIFDFTLPEARKIVKEFDKNDIVIFGTPVIAGRVPNVLLKYLDTLKGNGALAVPVVLFGNRDFNDALMELSDITPVIAGRVPNVLLKYLDTLKGNGALAVPVVLFGNRDFNDALMELSDILAKDGFKPIGAGAFVGEHSFSKILAQGRPDEDDMKIMEEFSNKIYEKITEENFNPDIFVEITHGERPFKYYKPKDAEGNHIDIRKVIPKTDEKLCDKCGFNPDIFVEITHGERPFKYYKPKDAEGNHIDIRKVIPKTDEKLCDKCGMCAKVCPMGSIDFNNFSTINGICIKCCACIKKCHTGAKYFDDEGYLYHKKDLEEKYKRRAELKDIYIIRKI